MRRVRYRQVQQLECLNLLRRLREWVFCSRGGYDSLRVVHNGLSVPYRPVLGHLPGPGGWALQALQQRGATWKRYLLGTWNAYLS